MSDDPRAVAWTDEDESDEANDPIKVVPFDFDPFKSSLVRARWLRGTGCPTAVTYTDYNTGSQMTAADPGCPSGDPKDSRRNEGLLLVKTGPTGNNASAGADLKGVKGITLTDLGYDIRKGPDALSPTGSHCGAGAPRFNVQTSNGFYFVGCNSGTPGPSSASWLRLRWGPPCVLGYNVTMGFSFGCVTGDVQSIAIVFDEGQDAMGGPDMFGLAVLDNIDVNGQLVGRGPGN